MRTKLLATIAVVAAVAAFAATGLAGAAGAAGQMIAITNVSVSADRHVTVDWTGPPNGFEFGAIEIATKPDVGTDGDFFSENLVEYDLLTKGQQHWVGSDPIKQPGTYYVRVTGWWDGYSADDYVNYGSVYSQVVPFTANPICTKALVTPGHWTKKVLRKAHWTTRKGHRVWVKTTYKKVWVQPAYKTECH
jgi:hypothetical protein